MQKNECCSRALRRNAEKSYQTNKENNRKRPLHLVKSHLLGVTRGHIPGKRGKKNWARQKSMRRKDGLLPYVSSCMRLGSAGNAAPPVAAAASPPPAAAAAADPDPAAPAAASSPLPFFPLPSCKHTQSKSSNVHIIWPRQKSTEFALGRLSNATYLFRPPSPSPALRSPVRRRLPFRPQTRMSGRWEQKKPNKHTTHRFT